jgi:hypothetical protein
VLEGQGCLIRLLRKLSLPLHAWVLRTEVLIREKRATGRPINPGKNVLGREEPTTINQHQGEASRTKTLE